jgi:hypothetical protein
MPERAAEALRDAIQRGGDNEAIVWIALGEAIVAQLPAEVRGPIRLYTGAAVDEDPPPSGPVATAADDAGPTAVPVGSTGLGQNPAAGTTALQTQTAEKVPSAFALRVRDARALSERERRLGAELSELETIAEMLLELDASSRPAARLLRIVDHGRTWLAKREGGITRARLGLVGTIAVRTSLAVGSIALIALYGKKLLLVGGILLVILLLFAMVGA